MVLLLPTAVLANYDAMQHLGEFLVNTRIYSMAGLHLRETSPPGFHFTSWGSDPTCRRQTIETC